MLEYEKHRIANYGVFYISKFISVEEEEYLLRKIRDAPKQKWKQLANRRLQIWGGDITARGLFPQALPAYMTSYPALIERLEKTGAFTNSPHHQPNHIILNEYLAGQGIMPHEDGPTYFPVVATVSLGSHAVLNYYQYKRDLPSDGEGKVIDEDPVLSLLLEPRSLVISLNEMYTSYLHGINPAEEDQYCSHTSPSLTTSRDTINMTMSSGTRIANWDMLTNENIKKIVGEGGVLRRGTRYSLTCRDVERIAPSKSFRLN